MSCESCTGCFSAAPCSAPSPSLNGHISKEYRHFLKAARVCHTLLDSENQFQGNVKAGSPSTEKKESIKQDKVDHAFNTLISVLANNQFTAQTYLAQSYKQIGPEAFLDLSRKMAHHGFWGRLITWAFLRVKEDSERLRIGIETHDPELSQAINDEAEMFEVFNSGVSCQRIQWNTDPQPELSGA